MNFMFYGQNNIEAFKRIFIVCLYLLSAHIYNNNIINASCRAIISGYRSIELEGVADGQMEGEGVTEWYIKVVSEVVWGVKAVTEVPANYYHAQVSTQTHTGA